MDDKERSSKDMSNNIEVGTNTIEAAMGTVTEMPAYERKVLLKIDAR